MQKAHHKGEVIKPYTVRADVFTNHNPHPNPNPHPIPNPDPDPDPNPNQGPPEAEDPHAKDVHPCDEIAPPNSTLNVTLSMSAPKGVDSALMPNATGNASRGTNGSQGNGTTIWINGTEVAINTTTNGSNATRGPAPTPTPAPVPLWDGNDAPACVVRTENAVNCLAFAFDSCLLASGGRDEKVTIFNASSCEIVREFSYSDEVLTYP